MSFIFLFENIKVVVHEPRTFFWIPASIAQAPAVILNGPEIFFAKGIVTFINGPANLHNNDPKNPPYWVILEILASESFMIVECSLYGWYSLYVWYICLQRSHVHCY